jgi:hypothetical protein
MEQPPSLRDGYPVSLSRLFGQRFVNQIERRSVDVLNFLLRRLFARPPSRCLLRPAAADSAETATLSAPAAPHLQALVLYDVLRVRAWLRRLRAEPVGTGIALTVLAAGASAAGLACWRLGRSVARTPVEIFVAAGALGAMAVIVQGGMGRILADGPLERLSHDRRAGLAWTGARATVLGLPFLVALLAGAADAGAAGLVVAGAVLAAVAGLLPAALGRAPDTLAPAGDAAARPHDSRLVRRLGLWSLALLPLRQRAGPAPRWALTLVLAAVAVVLTRLAAANGGAEVGAAAALVGTAVVGASGRGLDPDLVAMLAAGRRPLWKLLALFTAGPSALALATGAVLVAASDLPPQPALASVAAGVALVALWTAADVLNLVAFGPTGLLRTFIYGGVAAVLLQATGPFALLALPFAAAALFRLADRRRWSAA